MDLGNKAIFEDLMRMDIFQWNWKLYIRISRR